MSSPRGAARFPLGRVLWAVVVALFCSWGLPVLAQPAERPLALLVVVPAETPLDAPEVDRWVELLKIERERRHLSPEELPLLRLSFGRSTHRAVLEKVRLAPANRVRTFTCERDGEGWPSKIVIEHEPGTPTDEILARVLKEREAPTAEVGDNLGLLLVSDAATAPLTKPFLQELGRFWLQRYGRVRPSPYPLASYDVGQGTTAESLRKVFPELVEGLPLVALCSFERGTPVAVLHVYRGFDTPASLVREVSGARGQALTEGARPKPNSGGSLPGPSVVGLSDDQERILLVSRLNETAQQLWNEAKEDKAERNKGPKRILLRVIEDSRRYVGGEAAIYDQILESLRDYEVEPLVIDPSSKMSDQAARFLQLGKALLQP